MANKFRDKIEKKVEKVEKLADSISIACQEINDLLDKEREYEDGAMDEFADDEKYDNEFEDEEDIDEDQER